MSRVQEIVVYDRQQLITLVGLRTEAQRDSGRLSALIGEVRLIPEPPVPKPKREQAAARLTRLRELKAPWLIIRNHLMIHNTKEYLLRRLKRGRVPNSWVFGQLAVRRTAEVDDSLYSAYWLIDPERRKPEHVLTPEPNKAIDFWLLNLPKTDSSEKRHLFGSTKFRLGSKRPEWLNASSIQPSWHDSRGCSEAASFFQRELRQRPPPLSEFALCYPQLFAMRYALSGHPHGVPSKADLALEYEKFVGRAHRVLNRLLRIDLDCARRDWSRRSLIE